MVQYDTRNWVRILLTVQGTVLPRIALRTLLVAVIGTLAWLITDRGDANLAIPSSVHTLVGLALGLLLVFRTNASYDRFWEGRRMMGALVNTSRDLARQLRSFLDASPPGTRAMHGELVVALYATTRRYLRNEREWPELAAQLGAERMAVLAATRCPPLVVARWLSDALVAEAAAGRLSEHRLAALDLSITKLIDFLGGAERIMKTPVPFAYAHHIKGFLTLFCLTAPLALLGSMQQYTPLASAIVAYAMFGIDEIGVEIEDPFGYDPNDLPLDAIGDTIATDVRELVS